MTNQEAIEELQDMAFHPSLKKSLSVKCIAKCISALTEQMTNEQKLQNISTNKTLGNWIDNHDENIQII